MDMTLEEQIKAVKAQKNYTSHIWVYDIEPSSYGINPTSFVAKPATTLCGKAFKQPDKKKFGPSTPVSVMLDAVNHSRSKGALAVIFKLEEYQGQGEDSYRSNFKASLVNVRATFTDIVICSEDEWCPVQTPKPEAE